MQKPRQNKSDLQYIDHETFDGVSYRETDLSGREYNNCNFIKCDLYGANFAGSVFHDCVFESCDLSLIKLKECTFMNLKVSNSKAIGILWYEAKNLMNLEFNNSTLDYSSFYSKNLKKLKVTNCKAHEVDFTLCFLGEADFEVSDLLNAVFRDCDLTKANFVNARNYNINLQINSARQARFSMPDAMSLLDSFGVIVEG